MDSRPHFLERHAISGQTVRKPAALIPFVSGRAAMHNFQVLSYTQELFTVATFGKEYPYRHSVSVQFICDSSNCWWILLLQNNVSSLANVTSLMESPFCQRLQNKQDIHFGNCTSVHLHFIHDVCDALVQNPQQQPSQSSSEMFHQISTLIDQLEDEMCCSICAEHFAEPTVLSCGHSFCGGCITSWASKTRHQKSSASGHSKSRSQHITPCPVCQQKFKVQVANRALSSFVELGSKVILARDQYLLQTAMQQQSPQPPPRRILFPIAPPPTATPTSVIVKPSVHHPILHKVSKVLEVIDLVDDDDEDYDEGVDEGIDEQAELPPVHEAYNSSQMIHYHQPHEVNHSEINHQSLKQEPLASGEEEDEVVWL